MNRIWVVLFLVLISQVACDSCLNQDPVGRTVNNWDAPFSAQIIYRFSPDTIFYDTIFPGATSEFQSFKPGVADVYAFAIKDSQAVTINSLVQFKTCHEYDLQVVSGFLSAVSRDLE